MEIMWRFFYKGKMERELYNNCVILKNLAIVQKDMPMSTDYIVEQLMESSKLLKNIYAEILLQYRSGKGSNAFELLYNRIPSKRGRTFASILGKLELINPNELILQMKAFEESFCEERVTAAMKRAEKKSMLTTIMATISVFAILLNFTVVVIFMDTISMLGKMF